MNVFLKAKSHNADGFSNIVALGDFVFVSGQLGQGKTFDEQCRSVFEKRWKICWHVIIWLVGIL